MQRKDAWNAMPCAAGGQDLLSALMTLFGSVGPTQGRTGRKRWWTPTRLAVVMVVMAWHRRFGLVDRFHEARRVLGDADQSQTYQGMVKAYGRVRSWLWPAAMARLREAMDAESDVPRPAWACGFRVFGVDGSKFELPRTEANEMYFGTAGTRGDLPGSPQAAVTILWDMILGLVWNYRSGTGHDGERGQLRDMIPSLPADTLLIGDAGFVGYELMSQIAADGRHFLVRVGSNVRLLRKLGVYELQDSRTVYLWPQKMRDQGRPPLVLRLIRVRTGKGKAMYLLTNVLDRTRMSDRQAAVLYRKRWGVELCYRAMKQTLEARKLHARAPRQVEMELGGLIVGLTALGLLSARQLLRRGVDALAWSVARALRITRRLLALGGTIATLGQAVKEPSRRRRKTRRCWPRKKHADPPPGRPKLRRATATEIQIAKRLAA